MTVSSADTTASHWWEPARVRVKTVEVRRAIDAALRAAPGNGQSFGGVKVTTANGWFAARPSGTEDVYKIYAESFKSQDHLRQIQEQAQAAITAAFAAA